MTICRYPDGLETHMGVAQNFEVPENRGSWTRFILLAPLSLPGLPAIHSNLKTSGQRVACYYWFQLPSELEYVGISIEMVYHPSYPSHHCCLG